MSQCLMVLIGQYGNHLLSEQTSLDGMAQRLLLHNVVQCLRLRLLRFSRHVC